MGANIEIGFKNCRNPNLGLATKVRGLQGCGPRRKPESHFTCSRECKECEGMNPHTPKGTPMLGVGVPKGFWNFLNVISGVKTHPLEEIFISLESYWSVDVQNGFASFISTSETQVICKREAKSQIGSLTPDH